jgi:hypothetical protein
MFHIVCEETHNVCQIVNFVSSYTPNNARVKLLLQLFNFFYNKISIYTRDNMCVNVCIKCAAICVAKSKQHKCIKLADIVV